MQNTWKPTKRLCTNCGQVIIGYRNDKGLVKLQCPKCGLVMVSKRMSRRHERIDSKRMSRRHERIDITPPPGEYIDN